MIADFVVGLFMGDESKGKVTYQLLKTNHYTHSIRFNGSSNAGHTIYHQGKKLVTHLIPAGIFFGVRSVIGPGCVLNVKSFFEELEYLKTNGADCYVDCKKLVKVANNVHIVTDKHLEEDGTDTKIGTTKRGVGPAYRDKYGRTGILAKDIPELQPYLIDFHEEVCKKDNILLFEGAQGFYLDPHFGEYPYVTSSHCTVAGALINGIPHTAVRDVWGVEKAYQTYVGLNKFQPDGEIYNQLQKVGLEIGSTTGRSRQCNFLNLDLLEKAVIVNGVNKLVINKMDVLQKLNSWKIIEDGKIIDLEQEESFKVAIESRFKDLKDFEVKFSYSPEHI